MCGAPVVRTEEPLFPEDERPPLASFVRPSIGQDTNRAWGKIRGARPDHKKGAEEVGHIPRYLL